MAIMAPHIQIVKRSCGRSAIGFAAYRAASLLYDERTGLTHDYTRKSGVIHTEILAPAHAPEWVYDRQELWRQVELAARRKDAQLAREVMLPLPAEISDRERVALVRSFVKDAFVAHGMIADIAIHLPDRRGDQRNHHAHITCTMRHITPDGFGKQAREWNDDFAGLRKLYALRRAGKTGEAAAWEDELKASRPIFDWREKWAAHINRYLAAAGYSHRVDHRSWMEQGIDREPEIHLGVEATHLERKGERTRAGDARRNVQERNGERARAEAARRAQHHAGALLDTRKALAALRDFDTSHSEINHLDRQISRALSMQRHYENRLTYARTLTRRLRTDFEKLYGDKANLALDRFKKDIARLGVTEAANRLARQPTRYAAIPGYAIGRSQSRQRRESHAQAARTAELARHTYHMTQNVRHTDAPLRAEIERRLATLKREQARLQAHPPEGRLILQRALEKASRGLDDTGWQALSRAERFHVMQARTVMRDRRVRVWADERAIGIIHRDLAPAPSRTFMLSLLTKPVDLAAVTGSSTLDALDQRHREAAARHKRDLDALEAARKAAKEGLEVRHTEMASKGFTAVLARTPGLAHLLDAVIARHRRTIEEEHSAAKRAATTTYRAELEALQRAYIALGERHAKRLDGRAREIEEAKEASRKSRTRGQSAGQVRPEVKSMSEREARRRIILAKMRESGREIAHHRGLAYGRREKRKPPDDNDVD